MSSSYEDFEIGPDVFGALVQYPATDGAVLDYSKTVENAHAADALVTVAADLLSLVLLTPPGEWGADIVVGNTPALRRSARLRRPARGVLRDEG